MGECLLFQNVSATKLLDKRNNYLSLYYVLFFNVYTSFGEILYGACGGVQYNFSDRSILDRNSHPLLKFVMHEWCLNIPKFPKTYLILQCIKMCKTKFFHSVINSVGWFHQGKRIILVMSPAGISPGMPSISLYISVNHFVFNFKRVRPISLKIISIFPLWVWAWPIVSAYVAPKRIIICYWRCCSRCITCSAALDICARDFRDFFLHTFLSLIK